MKDSRFTGVCEMKRDQFKKGLRAMLKTWDAGGPAALERVIENGADERRPWRTETRTVNNRHELLALLNQDTWKPTYRFEWTGWSPRLNTVYLGHTPHVAQFLCRKHMGLPAGWNSHLYLGTRTLEEIGWDFEPGWGEELQYPASVHFMIDEQRTKELSHDS